MKDSIISSIGLISDTHYQDRLFDMPVSLENLLEDVDLILHAGDVGELSVLDILGKYAPTIAVHGNDEPAHIKQELPNQQLITIQGIRILLWHSHYADPIEEKANRKGAWGSKLVRIADRGCEVNAQIVIYGHTHIPMIYRHKDVILINPGALASGSYFTQQTISSVGKLHIFKSGKVEIEHFDVGTNQVIEFDTPNPDEDFNLLAEQFQEWIVETELIPVIQSFGKIVYEDVRAVVRAVAPLYKHCISNGPMRREDLIRVILYGDLITPNDKKSLLNAINLQP